MCSLKIKPKGKRRFEPFTKVYRVASPSKFSGVTIHEGDEIILISPGGGGYGAPFLRAPEEVLRDVEDGLVSIKAAQEEYGVSIRTGSGKGVEIDFQETTRLRAKKRA